MRYLYSNLERSQSCVVVGAGPAGLMLGLLLARSGVDVTVIEKHQDFLRDFRGDTIHPSTLEAMHELGYLDELLTLPHQKAYQLHAEIEGRKVTIADFSKLPTRAKFIAFMPQWDFLNFLARKAAGFPRFRLLMSTEITSLRWEAGTATDILWMKVSKKAGDPQQAMSHAGPRQGLVLIDRGDYWQCGYVITKGTVDALKDGGIGALRARIAEVAPLPADRFKEIRSWDDVHLLSVRIDRLKTWWKPGLLFIGDAAHAMSLIGGVGVNLAIQDAIATANLLAEALREGRMKTRLLEAVQRRRAFPTRATQKLQLMMRSRKRAGEADSARSPKPPLFMRLIARSPLLPRLTGRLIGLGFRPEHVRTQLVDWSCSLRKSAAPPR